MGDFSFITQAKMILLGLVHVVSDSEIPICILLRPFEFIALDGYVENPV